MKNGFKQHETSDVSDKKRKTSISLYSVFAGKSKTWKRTVSLLACMVVFFTTYALILPAITLEFEKAESTGMVLENGHELEGSEETLKSGQKEVPEAAGGQAADDFSNEAEDFAALDAVFTADISDNFPAEDFENAESIAVDFPEETEIQSDDLSDTFTCDASSCWAEVHLIDSDGLPKDTDFNFAPLEGEKAARYLAAVQERLGAGYQAEAASFYELSFANDGQLILPDGAFDLSVEYKEENAFHCDGTFFAVLFGKQENSNGNAVVPVESVMLKEKNADGSEIASIRDQRVTAWELKDVRFSEYRGIVGVVSVVEDKPEETDHTDAEIKEETADSEVNFIEEMDKIGRASCRERV